MVMFPFNMKYMKQKSPAASTCKRNVEEELCLPSLVHSDTLVPGLKFGASDHGGQGRLFRAFGKTTQSKKKLKVLATFKGFQT